MTQTFHSVSALPSCFWKWRLAACAAICCVAVGAAWISRAQAENACKARMGGISAALAGHAQQVMGSARSSLHSLAYYAQTSPQEHKAFHDKLSSRSTHDMLLSIVATNPSIEVASFIDSSGLVLAYSRSFPAPVLDVSEREYFKSHISVASTAARLSAPSLGKTNQHWSFYLTERINDSHGALLGLALVGISADSLAAFYQTLGAEMGDGFSVSLYRDDMMLLSRWPRKDDLIGSLNPLSAAGVAIHDQKLDHAELFVDSPRFTEGQRRQRRLAAPRKVLGEPLIIAPVLAESRCFDSWRSSSAGMVILALISCIGVLAWRLPRPRHGPNLQA
jgi:hypothetical protein